MLASFVGEEVPQRKAQTRAPHLDPPVCMLTHLQQTCVRGTHGGGVGGSRCTPGQSRKAKCMAFAGGGHRAPGMRLSLHAAPATVTIEKGRKCCKSRGGVSSQRPRGRTTAGGQGGPCAVRVSQCCVQRSEKVGGEVTSYCKEPLEQVPSGRCLRLPVCRIVGKTVTCWEKVGGREGHATPVMVCASCRAW